jgi:predicted metal-dependent hydrolase
VNRLRPRDRFGRPLPPESPDEWRRDPTWEGLSPEQALSVAATLFDAHCFFECHELFEHVWNSQSVGEEDRPFWKGLTQLAVGCCHLQRGNARGATALLERAIGYLQGFPSPHRGVDTRSAIDLARRLVHEIGRRGAAPDFPFPPFPRS